MLASMNRRAIHDDDLHAYPMRAGLVARPCDWVFSSARYYEQGRSVRVPVRWVM